MIKYVTGIYGFCIIVCLSLCIVLFACFGDRGLKEVLALQEELEGIAALNQGLERDNESLEKYVRRLEHDQTFIEKIAREELGMVGAGEIVYFFENR